MIKLINDNLDLYRPDKNSYLKSLEYAKELNTKTDKLHHNLSRKTRYRLI